MRWKLSTAVLALVLAYVLLSPSPPKAVPEPSPVMTQLQECRAESFAAADLVRQLRYVGELCRYDLGVERRLCTDEITDLEERLAAERNRPRGD